MNLIITEYTVPHSGTLPLTIRARHFDLQGQPCSWALCQGDYVYSKKRKQFEYEPLSSSRTKDFLKDHRFSSIIEVENTLQNDGLLV